MAAGGLLALLDDITALLDDIALMTKVAATKTAGITGDDLAVNAEAMIGIDPKRELPIVWRVAKGSFRNKIILIPIALILSAFAEWSITPLLMIGGTYLCFEAAEKVVHAFEPFHTLSASLKKKITRCLYFIYALLAICFAAFFIWAQGKYTVGMSANMQFALIAGGLIIIIPVIIKILARFAPIRRLFASPEEDDQQQASSPASRGPIDIASLEKKKIAQAVQTDFILSAEIVAVSLSYVKESDFAVQAAVLCIVGFGLTIGVYGLVAGIVKLDDLGMHLMKKSSAALKATGRGILFAAPWFMKTLGVVGTAAMFLVGGGILIHGIKPLDAALHDLHGPLHLLATVSIGIALGFAAMPLAKPLGKLVEVVKAKLPKKKKS